MESNLYRVYSTQAGVPITWIVLGRKKAPGEPLGGHAAFIEGLSSGVEATSRQQEAVDEFFTKEEAEAWCEYLREHCEDENIRMVDQPLPLKENVESLVSRRGVRKLRRPEKGTKYPSGDFAGDFEVWGIPNV